MAQYYLPPNEVELSWNYPNYPSRMMVAIIKRDGLIEPILVTLDEDGVFEAADEFQSERVMVCRELGFENILVETNWTEDDL